MGKTMCCTALILANPCTSPPVSDARFAKMCGPYDPSVHPVPLKLTLIIVNNTLVQQWFDECKRYAPKLNIRKHYASTKMRDEATMNAADIVVTTPHMKLPGDPPRGGVSHATSASTASVSTTTT